MAEEESESHIEKNVENSIAKSSASEDSACFKTDEVAALSTGVDSDIRGKTLTHNSRNCKNIDFRQTAKYKDTESYSTQHHHSIGSGLYLTDDIIDLPPRFRNKVIKALVQGAALNNISLTSDPLKLLCSVVEDPDPKEENSDSLVTFSTAKISDKSGDNALRPPVSRNSKYKEGSNSAKYQNSLQRVRSKDETSGFSVSPCISSSSKSFHKPNSAFVSQSLCSVNREYIEQPKAAISQAVSREGAVNASATVHPKYLPVKNKSAFPINGDLQSSQTTQYASKGEKAFLDSNVHVKNEFNPTLIYNSVETTPTNEYIDYIKKYVQGSIKPPSDVEFSYDCRDGSAISSGENSAQFVQNKQTFKCRSDSLSSSDTHISKPSPVFENKHENILHKLFPLENLSNCGKNPEQQVCRSKNDSHGSFHNNQATRRRTNSSNSINSSASQLSTTSEQQSEDILHRLFDRETLNSNDINKKNSFRSKPDVNSKYYHRNTVSEAYTGSGRNNFKDSGHNKQSLRQCDSANSTESDVSSAWENEPKNILPELFNEEIVSSKDVNQKALACAKNARSINVQINAALTGGSGSETRIASDKGKSYNAAFRPINKGRFDNSDKIVSKSQCTQSSANLNGDNEFSLRSRKYNKFDCETLDKNTNNETHHHNSSLNALSKFDKSSDKFKEKDFTHKRNIHSTDNSRNIRPVTDTRWNFSSTSSDCVGTKVTGVHREANFSNQVPETSESSRTCLNTNDGSTRTQDKIFSPRKSIKNPKRRPIERNTKTSEGNDDCDFNDSSSLTSSKCSNYSASIHDDLFSHKNPDYSTGTLSKFSQRASNKFSDSKFNGKRNLYFEDGNQSTKFVKNSNEHFNDNDSVGSDKNSQYSGDRNSKFRRSAYPKKFEDEKQSTKFVKNNNEHFNDNDSVGSDKISQYSGDCNSKFRHSACPKKFEDEKQSTKFVKNSNEHFNDNDSVVSDKISQYSGDRNSKFRHSAYPKKFEDKKQSTKFVKNSNEHFNDNDSVGSYKISQYSGDRNSKFRHSAYPKKFEERVKQDARNIENHRPSRNSHFNNDESIEIKHRGCVENGFFIKIAVSEEARNLEYWVHTLRNIFTFRFDVERCCHFSDILIITFERKEQAVEGERILWHEQRKSSNSNRPHITDVSKLKFHLTKPCDCQKTILHDSINNIEKNTLLCVRAINEKIDEIINSKDYGKSHPGSKYKEVALTKDEILKTFRDSKSNFLHFKEDIVFKVEKADNLKSIQHLKLKFIRECNTFKRCLPIYSRKSDILNSVRFYSVSVIVAETGSGKSTQLVEYLLHSNMYQEGLIICTQPRKLAAITIAQFVSGQIGSAVGKIVGYDVGMEKKRSDITKILYMTDYCLLKTCLRDVNLKDVSYVIIDEAHERSLYTDLLLGKLKQLLPMRPDLRIIITSATINPSIFVEYFDMPDKAVINVPGRSYPVDVIWWSETVNLGWNYLQACVKKAYEIHRKERKGDILVFLTSPGEAEEAINMFRNYLTRKDDVLLFCLHGKSDIKEQMQVFQVASQTKRRIIFATNVAETSVTIPGVKYVIDSGMTKELMFDPKKNKSYLAVTFINKSSAEQRKGRAGRTQSGVCYRLYSKTNMESMADNAVPEILKSNLQKAILKIFELGIEPSKFDFIEAPSERTISNSIDSLEYLGAIENGQLTVLGKKLVKLPLEPQLSKVILLGIEAGIGYETILIAALLTEAGKLFLRFEDNKVLADEMKKRFCQSGGDLCTLLEVYKRWREVSFRQRFDWCVQNLVSSKALNTAEHTAREIIFSLKNDLGISVVTKYNAMFKKKYERVLFDSFSENLCVSSGHPKLGYLSPFLSESFFIHPSSSLSYLAADKPDYLVYSTLMETSRNFLFDVTPISEETIQQANEDGTFTLPLHSLKCLQFSPKIMGPFGESVLIRYILGKQGSKVKDLESRIRNFTNTKNVQLDVAVDKGLITIYCGKRFHEKIAKDINEIIEKALVEMLNEEDVIKLSGTSMYYALGAGGNISDIIMPGEYRELILRGVSEKKWKEVEELLKSYGLLHSVDKSMKKKEQEICATYKKVLDAKNAFSDLRKRKICSVSSKPCLLNVKDRTLPLYLLNVSWCRSPCNGNGKVEFSSELDLVSASAILTSSSFYLDENYVMFTPSPYSIKDLLMKNLPANANEKVIKAELDKLLPKDLDVKNIEISRNRNIVVTDAVIEDAKKKLQNIFGKFTIPAKLVIDMKYPQQTDIFWKAQVYFESLDDGEEAFQYLKGNATIDSYPMVIERVLKSSVSCSEDLYQSISKQIDSILMAKDKEGSSEKYSVQISKSKGTRTVEFVCASLAELLKMKRTLMHLVQGDSLDFIGVSKYHFLFSDSLSSTFQRIGKYTNTKISLNKFKKVITIYGSVSDCQKAKEDIYSFASNSDMSCSRVFSLQASSIPNGFLKKLFMKYGYDLHGLVDSFHLKTANIELSRLTLTGKSKSIKQAEAALEKLCEELYNSRGKKQELMGTEEFCPVCLEPVTYDFFRLEHCGHAVCRQCLLLQLESKYIPFVCVKENCGKLIFLEDIKRIISFGGDHLKKAFCAAALQYHISCNPGKISYCLTPDCQMIYRCTDESSEFNCPECRNSICTKCQKIYHYGMTCEMFENCEKDEDYSLKFWVEKNKLLRKNCPSCKTIIEKDSGCNHMECVHCKAHFCWLCLKIFPVSEEVYEHMPYCKNNQTS